MRNSSKNLTTFELYSGRRPQKTVKATELSDFLSADNSQMKTLSSPSMSVDRGTERLTYDSFVSSASCW